MCHEPAADWMYRKHGRHPDCKPRGVKNRNRKSLPLFSFLLLFGRVDLSLSTAEKRHIPFLSHVVTRAAVYPPIGEFDQGNLVSVRVSAHLSKQTLCAGKRNGGKRKEPIYLFK